MAKRVLTILIVSVAMPLVLSAYRRELEQFGIDVCGCQPAEIVFEINVAGTCNASTLDSNSPGISSTDCTTSNFADESGDRTPVYIDGVEVFEYMRNSDQVAPFLSISERLDDGATFRFASLISTQEATIDEMTVPNEIFLSFLGYNSAGHEVYNSFQINFSNECGVHPVLAVGDAMGWVSITSVEESSFRVCPRPAPTMHPTDSPTTPPSPSPTHRPTVNPTSKPTAEPSKKPFGEPSSSPSASPSSSPSASPSAGPTSGPTAQPSASPSSSPRASPSAPPPFSPKPSHIPTAFPSSGPILTPEPTSAPSSPPTDTPTTRPTSLPIAEQSLFDLVIEAILWIPRQIAQLLASILDIFL